MKKQREIDRLEEQLAWQGANPKHVPFDDLKAHIQTAPQLDPIDAKYQARIKNRATAIRAYCVQCQGGSTADVKRCPSVTCPMYPFRMGKDPLRGYELPKADPIIIEDDTEADVEALFEDGDEDEADAVD